jgi:ABC-2 type transport system ATP-binding protein
VAIARALLHEPRVLFFDEPTAALDPEAARTVRDHLVELIEGARCTVLLCTHNLAEAEALCDEVIILRAGQVLVHDSLEALRLRARPQLRLTARQGAATLVQALRDRGLDAGVDEDEHSVLLAVDEPELQVPDLLRGLLGDGVDVFECHLERATLESLFLDLVQGDS